MLAGRVSLVIALLLASTASAAPHPPGGRDAAAERAFKLLAAHRGAARLSVADQLEARSAAASRPPGGRGAALAVEASSKAMTSETRPASMS